MRSLLFWSALPLLAPQALYVRRTAPRFAGATGPNHGAVGSGEALRLLAIGDSIIAGVGAGDMSKALAAQTAASLAAMLQRRVEWRAHGVVGSSSSTLLGEHLPAVPSLVADIVITSVGINDVTSMATLPRWRANLERLFGELVAANEHVVVAFAGLPPLGGFPLLPQPLRSLLGLRASDFDQAAIDVIARYPQVIHVPVDFETTPDRFADDGYHPNESSYVIFGESMAEKIVARLSNR